MFTTLLTDREALESAHAIGVEQRELDLRRVVIAADIESRTELVRVSGFANAAFWLAEMWGVSRAEAQRLVDVGVATRPRVALDGSPLPARFEVLAQALPVLGVERVAVAVRELSRAVCSFEARVEAEQALVDFGAGFTVADFAVLARQVRDRLDQDGAAPRDAIHHQNRTLRLTELSNGMTKLVWEMPPATAGLVRAGIDAIVSAEIRKAQKEEIEDLRTFEQRRADAAHDIFRHAATCEHAGGDLPSITMVVRLTLDQLRIGAGTARIDGVSETISIETARRMAADAEFIPMVFGGASLPLDVGMAKRLFPRYMKLAFGERDGGCAVPGCTSPACYADGHHITWYSNDGPTNLDNGVLLCSFHHHRVHDDGYQIEVIGGVPWWTPPIWVDPTQTPRRGGRITLATVN